MGRNEIRIQESPHHAAERKARPQRADDARPDALRHIFRRQREEARRGAAEAHAGEKPDRDQALERIRERRHEGESGEQQGRDDQHRLAAEAIGQRPERESADGGAERRRGENRAEGAQRNLQLGCDRRRRHTDRERIDAVEQRDEAAQDDDANLELRKSAIIDHAGDVDRRIPTAHGRLPSLDVGDRARSRASRVAASSRFVVEGEICRRDRPPDVERVVARMVTRVPVEIRGDVVDVGRIFRIAAPGVADVVEIVRAQHVAAEPPAGGETAVRHLHGAEADLVDRAHVPAQMVQAGRIRFRHRHHVVVAAVHAMHEGDAVAGAIGQAQPDHP